MADLPELFLSRTGFKQVKSTVSPNLTGPVTSVGNATSISNSINLPGSPTTTTQSPGDNSTKISTTAYVDYYVDLIVAAINAIIAAINNILAAVEIGPGYVRIHGVLIVPDGLDLDLAGGLTATGTTVADALQLTSPGINEITTVAAGTGVILTQSDTGRVMCVINSGANPLQIYGNGSDTIDGNAAATGVTLTNGKRCLFFGTSGSSWISMMGDPAA